MVSLLDARQCDVCGDINFSAVAVVTHPAVSEFEMTKALYCLQCVANQIIALEPVIEPDYGDDQPIISRTLYADEPTS